MTLEDIILEILDEMGSMTGSYAEPMDSLSEEDELDELNATSTTGDMSYNTPGAFRSTDGHEDEEESGFNDGHKDPEVLGYKKAKVSKRNFESEFKEMAREMLLSEVTYRAYKYDKTASPKEKVNKSIHSINSQLIKIERIIQQNIRLKQESGVDNQQYWKSTRNKFQKVNERLMRISGKLRELWR
jgi:hypothetical protein